MKDFYCSVTSALASFRLLYVSHCYIEPYNKLILKLKAVTEDECKDLNKYVGLFSEAITVRQSDVHKNQLISNIYIEGEYSSITFKGCMLESINFQDFSPQTNEVELIFRDNFKVKKLYLSGPMSLCKDEATWRANFQKYEEIFTEKGYYVVNPAKNPILPTYEQCLKHSLQQEMECDCVFFMPNSILSTGARLEYEIAKACGLEIVVLDEDISMTDNYGNNSGMKSRNS